MNFDVASMGYSEGTQKYDQKYIDELVKQIRQSLDVHDFESVIRLLPDNLLLEIINETNEEANLCVPKVYCLIMLGRKNEACELMEKLVTHHNNLALLFHIKGLVDCFNDNFGDATISFSNAIKINESTEMTYACYMQRVSVYAMRQLRKEVAEDLLVIQKMKQQFPGKFSQDTPTEFLIREYLAEPQGKIFYRREVWPSNAKNPSLNVFWWCTNISEEATNEFFRLFGADKIPR